jgi:hypothetical protein
LDCAKYITLKGWRKNSNIAYQKSRKLGIKDAAIDLLKRQNHKSYTKNELVKLAKKYKTKKDFSENCLGAYSAARKAGILEKICSSKRLYIISQRKSLLSEKTAQLSIS